MLNLKGPPLESDLISTECIGQDLLGFEEERLEFPLPFKNDDPFNLFESPQKYEDISIYLSLNKENDSNMKFIMNDLEQIYDGKSSQKSNKVTNPQIQQNLRGIGVNKEETMGETKNIPKNFGKQLIKFVKKNSDFIEKMLKEIGSSIKYQQFNSEVQKRKRKMNKIGDLRQLWLDKTKFGREMRIISCCFLRRFAYGWIFNSRVENYRYHLKYRSILLKLIKKPDQFVFLKTDF